MKRRLSKNVKCSFVPSLIFLALASNLHATTFWKSDLNENLTHITKRIGEDNFTVAEDGRLWPGVGPNGEAPGTVPLYYSRIPAMTITDDNKMVIMYDLDGTEHMIKTESIQGYPFQKMEEILG